jgi:hypothetical protein
MKQLTFGRRVLVLLAAVSSAFGQDKPADGAPPTWQDMLAAGIVPYRQLKVEDFAIDDAAHPKHGFYIKTAIEPRYHFILKPHTNGFVYAHVDQWMVFSGFNKKASSRKSKFKTMKEELPFAQGILDITEIHARRLAALKPGELPSGRGANFDEARADMEAKLKQFVDAKYAEHNAELESFAKATKNGADRKKVRQLAAEIRKRLDATPATTVPFGDAQPGGATPSVSASPAASASPSPSAAATPR